MSVDLAKLVVTLEAESARFQKELSAARAKLAKFDKDAHASAVAIGTFVGNAMTQVAHASYEAAKAAVEYADKAGKAAQAAGTSVEFFSQLAYTAGLADVSTEELGSNLAKFTKNIGEAITGTKAQAEAFSMLGISQKDLKESSPEQVFLMTAEAMSNMADGSKKNLVAQALFSKSFASMIPLLNQGSAEIEALNAEADKLGLTVSNDAAKAADEFGDTLDKMGAAARGVANGIMRDLTPALQVVADEFLRAATEGGGFKTAGEALKVVMQTVVSLGADVAFVFKGVGGEIGTIAAQANALAHGNFRQAKFIGEEWTKEAQKAREDLDAFQAKLLSAGEAATTAGRQGGATAADWATKTHTLSSGLDSTEKSAKKLKDTVGDLLRELEKEGAVMNLGAAALAAYNVAMAGGTTAQVERARMLAESNRLMAEQKDAMEAGKALTVSMQTPIESLVARESELDKMLAQGAITQQTYTRAMEDARKTFQAADPELVKLSEDFAAVDAIIAQTTSGKLEEARKQVEQLAAAYEQGRFGAQGSAEAAKAYAESVLVVTENATQKGKEETDAMSEYAKSAAQNMQSAFADFLFDPFASSAEDMAANFAKTLQRMAAEAAAAQIFDAITGAKGGKGGDGGMGLITSIGSAIGSYFGGGSSASASTATVGRTGGATAADWASVQGNAKGGMVQPGELSWVGEKGPELAAAGSATKILSNSASMQLANQKGGGTTVYNITTPDADSFRASERQITRKARMRLTNG